MIVRFRALLTLHDVFFKGPFGTAHRAASRMAFDEAVPNGRRQNGSPAKASRSPAKCGLYVSPSTGSQKKWLIPAPPRHFPSLSPVVAEGRRSAGAAPWRRRSRGRRGGAGGAEEGQAVGADKVGREERMDKERGGEKKRRGEGKRKKKKRKMRRKKEKENRKI